jgi:hypothetical protein
MTTYQRFNLLIILAALLTGSCNHEKYDLSYDKYYDHYTFDQLKDTLFSDTVQVGRDVDSSRNQRQWYVSSIKELITDLSDDYGKPDSLYPMMPFDKIKVSKSPWEWSQALTNDEANKLLKIITNPLSFDWSKVNDDDGMLFEFYRNGQVVESFFTGADNSRWPNCKKMKRGHLKREPKEQLSNLLKEIER